MKRGPLVVIGDALLDADLEGTADRLAPDAPVPVVDCRDEHHRAGGAGLAATFAADLAGTDVVLITAIGDDERGRRLADLVRCRLDLVAMPLRGATPCKMRVRASGQSLVRLDVGDGLAADGPLDERVEATLASAGAVLVSDYGRGVAGLPAVRDLLRRLPGSVPVVWDPHPRGATPTRGARLVTPNRSEARVFAEPMTGAGGSGSPLGQAAGDAAALVRGWAAAGVAVTLGANGALLSVGDGAPLVAPPPANVASNTGRPLDTCGAGDRFAAAAVNALWTGALLTEAVMEAVAEASAFVTGTGSGSGTASGAGTGEIPDWGGVVAAVRRAGGRVVATGGCFDLLHAGHVRMLREARRLGDCLVVCVNSDSSVRELKGDGRPLVPATDRARVLAALEFVDTVIVFDEPTPSAVLDRVRPDVWVKGGDYSGADLPESEVVRRHGGEVVMLPYLAGRSTTRLVAAARQATAPVGNHADARVGGPISPGDSR